ncbi:WD40-repeat-containing domain protein [Phycomyces blakesleeanus]
MSENDQINDLASIESAQQENAPQSSYAITRNDTILYPLANMSTPKSMRRILFNLDGTESLFEEVSRNLLDVSQDELPIRSPRKRPASLFVDSPCDNDDQTEVVENREDHQKSIRQKRSCSNVQSIANCHIGTHPPLEASIALPIEPLLSEHILHPDPTLYTTLTDTADSPNSALPSPSLSPEMTSATDELWEGNSFEPEANSLVDLFDAFPPNIQSYVLLQLSRRTSTDALRNATALIMQSLRTDILSRLPPFLTHIILRYLDIRSLCRASRVSKHWHTLIENDEELWSSNLKTAGFVLSPDEINEMEKPFARKQIYRRHHIMRLNWKYNRASRKRLYGHTNHAVTCLQFDEDKVITGSDDHSVNVYDIKSGKLMRILNGHSGGVWALKYVGNTLVTGSTDRTVRIWDINAGVCRYIFQGHSSTVRCLTIIVPTPSISSTEEHSPQPSQPLIVSGSRDFTLKVWRLPDLDEPVIDTDQKESTYLLHTLSGHTQSVRALAAHGSTVVSGSYDHTVRVWDVEHGKAGHVLTGHTQKVYSVVIDPKRNHCISGSMDSSVRIWNLEDGTCVSILRGHSILVGLLGLSGDCLVSAAADSSLRVWSAETGECQYLLAGHKGAITAFQHDSQKIISGSEGGLKMWCTKTGTLLHELIDDISGVWVVSFDERRCIAAVKSDDVTRLEILDFGVHGLE